MCELTLPLRRLCCGTWRISVASVNCRTSQKPKMAMTFWPGTMGFRSPPLRMLSAMISAPASPKPTAIKLHMQRSTIRSANF